MNVPSRSPTASDYYRPHTCRSSVVISDMSSCLSTFPKRRWFGNFRPFNLLPPTLNRLLVRLSFSHKEPPPS